MLDMFFAGLSGVGVVLFVVTLYLYLIILPIVVTLWFVAFSYAVIVSFYQFKFYLLAMASLLIVGFSTFSYVGYLISLFPLDDLVGTCLKALYGHVALGAVFVFMLGTIYCLEEHTSLRPKLQGFLVYLKNFFGYFFGTCD